MSIVNEIIKEKNRIRGFKGWTEGWTRVGRHGQDHNLNVCIVVLWR